MSKPLIIGFAESAVKIARDAASPGERHNDDRQ
jgi:hypothetical protein